MTSTFSPLHRADSTFIKDIYGLMVNNPRQNIILHYMCNIISCNIIQSHKFGLGPVACSNSEFDF
jgi:hypothetical protein